MLKILCNINVFSSLSYRLITHSLSSLSVSLYICLSLYIYIINKYLIRQSQLNWSTPLNIYLPNIHFSLMKNRNRLTSSLDSIARYLNSLYENVPISYWEKKWWMRENWCKLLTHNYCFLLPQELSPRTMYIQSNLYYWNKCRKWLRRSVAVNVLLWYTRDVDRS